MFRKLLSFFVRCTPRIEKAETALNNSVHELDKALRQLKDDLNAH